MNKIRSFCQQQLPALLMCLMLGYSFTIASPAYANTTNTSFTALTNVLCVATNALTGPVGRVIAIVIIASLAISLFLGKVSWGLAIATMLGMGILFGATSIVSVLSTQGGGASVTTCGG